MALEENLQEHLLKDYDSFPVSIQVLYERSLNIEQFKDFRSFKNIINHAKSSKPLPNNYVDADFKDLNKVCLDIASKNGLTAFVKMLLRQGVKKIDLNRVNKTFNRAPIHFAIEGGHVDTLEALLAEPTVNPDLLVEQQTALHIAVNNNNQKCASLLLQNGASANIPNSKGLTAIQLAVIKRHLDIVKLILQEYWQRLALDNYRDHNNRKQTIEEIINQNLPLSKESYDYTCHYTHIHFMISNII